jgi:hypothetical protein
VANDVPASVVMAALALSNPMNPNHYLVIRSGLTAAWADWAGDCPTRATETSRSSKSSKALTIPKPHTRACSTNHGVCRSQCYSEVSNARLSL